MAEVEYNKTPAGKYRVSQRLGTLDIRSGTFDEIIEQIQKEKDWYQPGKVMKVYANYIDNQPHTRGRELSFDKITVENRLIKLNFGEDARDQYELTVVGERDPDENELKALLVRDEQEETDRLAYEKAQYEKLQAKFGKKD